MEKIVVEYGYIRHCYEFVYINDDRTNVFRTRLDELKKYSPYSAS